jgi:uncharacterized membrane protein (DUF485 family)
MPPADTRFRDLAASHRRITVALTLAMIAVYFGFILLIAYGRSLLSAQIAPGLTLGILLGVLVIVAAWLLTWIYVRWANTHYDAEAHDLRRSP